MIPDTFTDTASQRTTTDRRDTRRHRGRSRFPKGQATTPKELRGKFGIETPGAVFVYEADGRIVIEPVPTMEELHGIHAGDHEPGEAIERRVSGCRKTRSRRKRDGDGHSTVVTRSDAVRV